MNGFVNLLPWTCRKTQLIRLRLVQWAVAWAAVGGLTVAACIVQWNQWSASRDRAEWMEQAYAPTNALLDEIKMLGRGVEQLQAREMVVSQLESSRPALTLLGLVSRSARECEGRLRVEQLSVASSQSTDASSQSSVGSRQRTTDNRQPSTDNGPPATSLTIKGIAVDDLAVARFVLALRQTKAFDRVELKSSQRQETGGAGRSLPVPRLRSYLVECGY